MGKLGKLPATEKIGRQGWVRQVRPGRQVAGDGKVWRQGEVEQVRQVGQVAGDGKSWNAEEG